MLYKYGLRRLKSVFRKRHTLVITFSAKCNDDQICIYLCELLNEYILQLTEVTLSDV